ncbi:30S ribosomal protein S20 [Candidatus Mycoplasma haematobovis]|uniref:Small ribosomal subunit protein bS20 n=1 Tax=Candidatus Mycoplasma haematobovis TaxID=432608 RepID=A0A1A9QCC1_9MOLU|nr:30S ribosomal protein S20 [Candidatus Mycoplasma haematobovis]OAL10103.1 30S ribosomal protein S20 [Candidatus Mycoplasma haematobovis]
MPNILSNTKSLKKDKARRLVRISCKKKLKRVVVQSLEKKDISEVYKTLDSQLAKGIIKKNKCNRLKSRYAIKLNNLS